MPSQPSADLPVDSLDAELERERAATKAAHADLAAMRERAASLDSLAGDAVSAAYLAKSLHERLAALADPPGAPLIFGRLDVDADLPAAALAGTTWRIGRRHVQGERGAISVLDWRADASRAFYQATPADRRGVKRRRRYGYDSTALTGFDDENLGDAGAAQKARDIIAAEIARPRIGPMRDIVSTIVPEQDDLVRSGAKQTMVIQGAPGTGKTAVGLHRAAWLLYAHAAEFARTGVLVIGPGEAFMAHIKNVLPALGEVSVDQTTMAGVVESSHALRVSVEDTPEAALCKSSAAMAEVARRAVWAMVGRPTEPLKIVRGVRTWRVADYEVRDVLCDVMGRGLPYNAAREAFPQVLARRIIEKMNEAALYPESSVETGLAKDRAMKAYVKALWPVTTPQAVLYRLYSDAEFRRDVAGKVLDEEQLGLLTFAPTPKPPRSVKSAKWSAADVVIADEIAALLDRPRTYAHVICDEAQDLSPMQLRAVGRRCVLGSATILGDIAQGTTPWATPSWGDALTHLGQAGAPVSELRLGFRVPGCVLDYAGRLLPHIAPDLQTPDSLRRDDGTLSIVGYEGDVHAAVRAAVERLGAEPGSIGVVVPDALLTEFEGLAESGALAETDGLAQRVVVHPARVVKGLEFDHVVVVDPAGIAAETASRVTGLRRLYVALTRSVTNLVVVAAGGADSTGVPELDEA